MAIMHSSIYLKSLHVRSYVHLSKSLYIIYGKEINVVAFITSEFFVTEPVLLIS